MERDLNVIVESGVTLTPSSSSSSSPPSSSTEPKKEVVVMPNVSDFKTFEWNSSDTAFLASTAALSLASSINDVIVMRLLSSISQEVLNIAGQLEWFDLMNETLLALLIMPLYYVFNSVKTDKKKFLSTIAQSGVCGAVVYVIFSIIIYIYVNSLTTVMNAPSSSVLYLRLETVAFVIGFLLSFMTVVFVVIGKTSYVIRLVIAKCIMLAIGDMMLIPPYGVNGVAITNILTNSVMSGVAGYLLYKEHLIADTLTFDKVVFVSWIRVGKYSFSTIFLDNLIYMQMICLMVNDVEQAGNYWMANNFIWGWLLLPVAGLGEVIKRDFELGHVRVKSYCVICLYICTFWLVSTLFWGYWFSNVLEAPEPDAILDITYQIVPFYVAYIFTVVIDSIFVTNGNTGYLLIISFIVNIIYYGVLYVLFYIEAIKTSMTFIILMFGCGMVVHLMLSGVLYKVHRRKMKM